MVSDFAFVNNNNRNILVLGANTDNSIVLVDLNDPNFRTVKLSLTEAEESTGGSSRKLEWAVGTNYVWVNGGETMEIYIIDIPSTIDSAFVSNTIMEVTSGDMTFVNNYERMRSSMQVSRLMMADGATINSKGVGLGVAGIIIGACALTVGLAVGFLVSTKEVASKEMQTETEDTPSLASKHVA